MGGGGRGVGEVEIWLFMEDIIVRSTNSPRSSRSPATIMRLEQVIAEALVLGQDLDVSADLLGEVFTTQGIWLSFTERRPEAVAYYREAVRLADQTGNHVNAGRALLNLSDAIAGIDPGEAVEAARNAVERLERTGNLDLLVFARSNLAAALLAIGEWDAVDAVLDGSHRAAGGEKSMSLLTLFRAWLLGLRAAMGRREAGRRSRSSAGCWPARIRRTAPRSKSRRHLRASPDQPRRCNRRVPSSATRIRWAWPRRPCGGRGRSRRARLWLRDDASPGRAAQLSWIATGMVSSPRSRTERDLVRARSAAVHGEPGAGKQ